MPDVISELAESPIEGRIAALDWARIDSDLDTNGFATTGPLLTAKECAELVALYPREDRFRSRVVMARHGFGQSEYQYFANPLPALVAGLRATAYPPLAKVANRWSDSLRAGTRFPPTLDDFLGTCHAANQCRPTPLLLKYGAGDYNCLHQDLYGEIVFPLQLAILLSAPERDFTGGEFVLVEQRPRMQSRAEVVPLCRGGGVIFAVRERPRKGVRGYHRANLRHGVSRVRSGERHTLGVIFHDAA